MGVASNKLSSMYLEKGQNSLGIIDPRWIAFNSRTMPPLIESIVPALNTPEFQTLMTKQFDVVVSASFAVGYIAEILDCNIIHLSTMGNNPGVHKMIGNQFFPSQSWTPISVFDQPETFHQRLINLVASKLIDMWVHMYSDLLLPKLTSELGYKGPSLFESMQDRLQLVLSNSHSTTHDPQPLLENVVHVGGMHIKQTKPLPSDLKDFLDKSPEGVILVSFGSGINPSSMREERRLELINAFKQLKQRIIWKWDGNVTEDLPDNVIARKWLPQQDLLAHPNLRMFITHGGMLSIMEAIYHGVLLVGTPLANDQLPNLKRVENNNIGKMMDWDTLTAEVLVGAINKALDDKSMAASMKEFSARFKDNIEHPVDTAAWWVEFVIRNNGTNFLKPKSIHQYVYQAWNLDLLAAGLMCLTFLLFVNFKIIRFFSYCWVFTLRKDKSE